MGLSSNGVSSCGFSMWLSLCVSSVGLTLYTTGYVCINSSNVFISVYILCGSDIKRNLVKISF